MICLVKPYTMTDACKLCDMSKEGMVKLVQNPRVREDKKQIPLFAWGNPKSPWIPSDDDYNSMAAISDNIKEYTAIQLDFDDGWMSVDQFIAENSDYRYYLYTSYNHGFKGDGDRFRVIMPLSTPLDPYDMGGAYKRYMGTLYPHCDMSCFDRAHFQCIPAVRPDGGMEKYRYHINDVNTLFTVDIDAVKQIAKQMHEEQVHIQWFEEAREKWNTALYGERERSDEERIQNQLNFAQSLLDNAVIGNRHNACWECACYLERKGLIEYSHVMQPPLDADEEWNRVLAQKYR